METLSISYEIDTVQYAVINNHAIINSKKHECGNYAMGAMDLKQ